MNFPSVTIPVFLFCVCSALSLADDAAVSTSFEHGAGGAPHGWTFRGVTGSKGTWADDFASTGKRSLKITGASCGGSFEEGGWRSDLMPAEPNRLYRFSVMTKSDSPGRWGTLLKIHFLDRNKKFLSKVDPYINDAHDWKELSCSGIAPAQAAYLQIFLYTYDVDKNITVWFDDMRIEKLPCGIIAKPADGETVFTPCPVLAWPEGQGKYILLARNADFTQGLWKQPVDNVFKFAQQINCPLKEGQWYWKAELVAGGFSKVRSFTVKPRPFMRRAFDFGGRNTPVQPDWTKVTPDTDYAAGRSYGWTSAGERSSDNQPNSEYRMASTSYSGSYKSGNRNQTFLTPLLRDIIQSNKPATFSVDLPNGQYDVLIVTGHPHEKHRPSYFDFDISAEGKNLGAMAIYYPGVLFDYRVYTVKVEDGRLDVTFASNKIDNVWAVTCMMVTPHEMRRQAAADINGVIDSIEILPEDILSSFMAMRMPTNYPTGTLLTPNAAENKSGYVLFQPGAAEELLPDRAALNGERMERITLRGTNGEYIDEPISIQPLSDVDDVSVECPSQFASASTKIISDNSELRRTGYIGRNREGLTDLISMRVYDIQPDRLYPLRGPLYLNKAQSVHMRWVLHIPEDAAPGKYSATVIISSNRVTREIPVTLEVLPFKLEPQDLFVNTYYDERITKVASGSSPAVNNTAAEVAKRFWDNYTQYMMTCPLYVPEISLVKNAYGTIGIDCEALAADARQWALRGKVSYAFVDYQGFVRKLVKMLGEKNAASFDKHISGNASLSENFWKTFARCFCDTHDTLKNTLSDAFIIYQLWDEAYGRDVPFMLAEGKAMKKLRPDVHIYANVPKALFYGLGNPEMAVRQVADVWWTYSDLSEDEVAKAQSEGIFLIGGANRMGSLLPRYSCGLQTWLLGARKGVQMWAWNYWYASASTYTDGAPWGEGAIVSPYHPLVNSLTCEAMRQGFYDYRYLKTLEKEIIRGESSSLPTDKNKAANAKRFLCELKTKIGTLQPSETIKRPRGFEDIRAAVTDMILELQSSETTDTKPESESK